MALASPGLKSEVFLASRERATKQLTEFLVGSPDVLPCHAASPNDVLDWVAAYLSEPSEITTEVAQARALIIEEKEAWRTLALADTPLVLIASPALPLESEVVADASQRHHVILCRYPFRAENNTSIELPRPLYPDLQEALVGSGIEEEKASRLARESGCSLAVLKRRLVPSNHLPEWSQSEHAVQLAPLVLAGGWDDSSKDDQGVVERLSDCRYEEILAVSHRWLGNEDSPLRRVGSCWSLVSREDSWLLLAPSVTGHLFERFERVALSVLGELDPCYEMETAERWLAPVRGQLPTYSHYLRRGLTETLVLLGTKAGGVGGDRDLALLAARVVQRLLKDAHWMRWASLSDHLCDLAEAAPEAFLDAVETDLKQDEPAAVALLNQESKSFMPSSPHTGLLWALETLAWKPEWLTRVILVLARLAEEDPGGSLANRPLACLRKIFLPWLPQTMASAAERAEVLEILSKRHPEVGFQTCLARIIHKFS